jgi:hypothetical protein
LVELTSTLVAHNAREVVLMKEVLPELDAWGTTRRDMVIDEHAGEHESMERTLKLAVTEQDAMASARATLRTLREIAAHMAREEKVFLNSDVLADDLVPDSFGG